MSTWKGFTSRTTPQSAIDNYVAQATYLMNEPRVRTDQLVEVPLTEGTDDTSPGQDKRPASRRGTTNVNVRGNTEDRRRRREYLVVTYRADVDAVELPWGDLLETTLGEGIAACRCYRCGCVLTAETVTVDRIKPGCQGGTYRRDNIRPACGRCNSETGGAVRGRR